MDLFKGIYAPILIVIFVCSGSYSSQLYLQPQDTQHGYFTGDSFFVTCFTADGNIEQLRWTDYDTNPIVSNDGRIHVQPASEGQEGLTLIFTSVEREDSGTYTCSDDQDSVYFELSVTRSISFGDTPHIQHAPEGDTGIIICTVRSDAHATVRWYFKGNQQLKNGEKYNIQDNSLKIFNLSRSDAGIYRCNAALINTFATQIKELNITLHVQYKPEIIGEPRISHYARIGTSVQLPCNVTAEPAPMFQWLRDERIVFNNTNEYTIFTTANSSVLQLNLESDKQLGVYICRAFNALGEEEVTVELKEGNPPHPPKLVVKDHNEEGVLKLHIEPLKDSEVEEELKTIGYKVEYTLATDESWDNAESQEFKIDEPHLLRNLTVDSEYLLRAAALNKAGYGEFSEHVRHKTKAPQKASVVASASGIVASTLVLSTSIVFFRLF